MIETCLLAGGSFGDVAGVSTGMPAKYYVNNFSRKIIFS